MFLRKRGNNLSPFFNLYWRFLKKRGKIGLFYFILTILRKREKILPLFWAPGNALPSPLRCSGGCGRLHAAPLYPCLFKIILKFILFSSFHLIFGEGVKKTYLRTSFPKIYEFFVNFRKSRVFPQASTMILDGLKHMILTRAKYEQNMVQKLCGRGGE